MALGQTVGPILGGPKILGMLRPRPRWDVGVADPLETRHSAMCVTVPNFVALGQTV